MVKVNCISGYTSERNKRVAYGFHLQLVPCNAQTAIYLHAGHDVLDGIRRSHLAAIGHAWLTIVHSAPHRYR